MKIPFVEMTVLIEGSAKRTRKHDELMMALDFIHGYMARVYLDDGVQSIMEHMSLEKINGALKLSVVWKCGKSRACYEDDLMQVMSKIEIEDYCCFCEGREITKTVLPSYFSTEAAAYKPLLVSVDKLPPWAVATMAEQQPHRPRSSSDQ